ncbi:MAG: type IV secretion system DNA-binding domain-containing protein [Cyanobacteria bacterium P01_D01_bin.156]
MDDVIHKLIVDAGEYKALKELLLTPNMVLLMGILVLCGLLYLLEDRFGKNDKLATARFASNKEREHARRECLKQMIARKHNEVGLTIGTPTSRNDRKRVYIPDSQRSILGVGGPGTGKSFSFIDPVLLSTLQQGFPTILYDFKYASQAKLAAYAASLGYEVHIFAPGYPESGVINPLQFLRSPSDTESSRQLITLMNKNLRVLTNSAANRFFDTGGDQIGEGVLCLARATEYPDLLMTQTILGLPQLVERLAAAEHINPWVKKSFSQLLSVQKAPETVSGLLASASEVFSRMMKSNLLATFCGESSIPLDLNDKQLIIFGMDRVRRDVVAPVTAAIINMLITLNVARTRELPLCVFLDELPTLVLPSLAQMINENRSDGLVCVAGIQSFPQLEKTYGRELARVIWAGFGHKIIFNPQDGTTAEEISKFLGNKEIRYKQRSRSYGHKSGRSRSVSEQRQTQPLISASDLLKMKTGECVIISPGFANKKEAYLPLKTKIKIPKHDQKIATLSKKIWPSIQQELVARSQARPPTEADVIARQRVAERLLPLPEEAATQHEHQGADYFQEQVRERLKGWL